MGRDAEALQHYRQAASLGSGDIVVQISLSGFYKDRGDYPAAIAAGKKAIALNGRDARAYAATGDAYAASGDEGHAAAYFLKALEFDSRHVEALLGMAFLLAENRPDEAKGYFKRALAVEPGNSTANIGYGAMLAEDGHCAEALPYLEKGKRLEPDESAPYYYLGMAYIGLKRYAEARSTLATGRRIVEKKNDPDSIQEYDELIARIP